MQFEWDEEKRRENLRKHGIDFARLPEVFYSPMWQTIDDRNDYGEERWIGMGLMSDKVVVVVWVERQVDVFRIISARKASPQERENYEQFLSG